MLRRIARLIVFGTVTLALSVALVAWYRRLEPVPYMPNYTIPCEQDATAAWCGSLQRIFWAGAIILGAGVILLVAGVSLVALVMVRMTRLRWLTAGVAIIAVLAGIGAFWLSHQALDAYYKLSLFPDRHPPDFFLARLAKIDRITQDYMAWSVGALALATAMLIFSFVILWSARKLPPQAIAPSPAV